MPIICNSKTRRIVVNVDGGAKVVLICRAATTEEYKRFMSGRVAMMFAKKNDETKLIDKREKWIDQLLVDIEAYDADGNADYVAYVKEDGSAEKLTPQVPDWKLHIPVSWKISASLAYELGGAEIESEALKN